MSIGTKADLLNAAAGRMPAKPYDPLEPANTSYGATQQRRSALSQSAMDRLIPAASEQGAANITGGLVGNREAMRQATAPSFGTSPTKTYAQMLGSLTRAGGGLSSEGKYGGFFSAGDLQSAIEGSAISFRERGVEDLRREAFARYAQIDPMYGEDARGAYGEARRPAQKIALSGVTSAMPSVPTSLKQTTPGGYIEKIVEPLREYDKTLADWYKSQAAPAEEYLQTAQQLEATPLSDLAQSIAVQQYGMNPDLAASKFRTLDSTYWKSKRDTDYMNAYGVPYDEYQAMIAEGEAQQRVAERATQYATEAATRDLEGVTGYKASTLSSLLGQTPSQLVEIAAAPTVVYDDPETGQEVSQNGAGVLDTVRKLLSSRDKESLTNLVNSVESREGQQDIARLIKAMMTVGGVKLENIEEDLLLAGY